MTPLNTAHLRRLAEAANEADREWRTAIDRVSQVGYELEAYFAACRSHRDNPRKNHFDLAEKDRKFIEAFNPIVALRLLDEYEIMKTALTELSEDQWDLKHGPHHWDRARECLASLKGTKDE